MMFVPINAVLNQVSKAVHYQEADNDQLISWALEGYRNLKFPGIQTVKDVDMFQVTNHRMMLPQSAIREVKVELCDQTFNDLNFLLTRSAYYSGDNLLQKDVKTFVQNFTQVVPATLVWTENGGVLTQGDNLFVFKNGSYLFPNTDYTVVGNTITITNHVVGNSYNVVSMESVYTNPTDTAPNIYQAALFTNQTFQTPNTSPIKKVNGYTSKGLCTECSPTYVANGNTLEFSFSEGTVLVTYTIPMMDEDGNYLIPQEPNSLHMYLAKYIEKKFMYEKLMLQNNFRQDQALYQMLTQECNALFAHAKSQLTLMNIDLVKQLELVYGGHRYTKVPSLLHRQYSHRYSGNYRTLYAS